MDWKIAATAFGAVFLAELGDKTQLAALTLTASTGRPLAVFAGASAALVLVTLVGVGVGAALGELLPLTVVRKAAAVAFIAIGGAMLAGWV
jgi:putative Ca2+/H+ antiporter (TMEM165/GDT1 family)